MNSVMTWIKANLAIVVLSALIILVLPAAFVGTHMWNKRIRTAREAAANKAANELNSLAITYAFPPSTPGGTPVVYMSPAPNPAASAYFREHRAELDAQITKVSDAAKEINQRGHNVLVDGLFKSDAPPTAPTPEGQPAQPANPDVKPKMTVDPFKALELAETVVGKPDKPSIYEALLKSVNAGGPADPVAVAEALKDEEGRFVEQVKAQNNRDKLIPEEQTKLTEKLTEIRVGMYQSHAAQVSVYATRDCLAGIIPASIPSEAADADTLYTWQYDYWVVSDLFAAVAAANTDQSGKLMPVSAGPVKRIERIVLAPALGPTDPSVTGRRTSAENKLYDVRHAQITAIVSSAGLPEFVNAISRTNFMSVIGLDFFPADGWADLDKGYYYGSDHVVRAVIKVETVWLRSWTEALMPQSFKDTLMGTSADAAASAPPVAAAPRAASRPAEDEAPAVRKKPTTKSTKRPTTKRGGEGGGG